jgi:hypothetical protein
VVNGKNKGNQFERDMCRRLSIWISDGKRDDLLWRSNSSGGQFTQRAKTKGGFESQAGDIVSIDPLSKPFMDLCTVELKNYNSLQLQGLLYFGKFKITTFWQTHVALSKKVHKMPILIGKELRKPTIILLPPMARDVFKYEKAPLTNGACTVSLLEDFLTDNPYKYFETREINKLME